MFPQQPQQQFRTTNANVQFFYGTGTAGAAGQGGAVWNKPPGVSQVYMLLIGGGGNNAASAGGSSGAVTTWWGSAQNVPDILNITASPGDSVDTRVQYRGSNGLNILLSAGAATTSTAGAAMAANQFTASGFFQSVAGQTQPGTTASTTTFLNAGHGVGGTAAVSQYGYTSGSPASNGSGGGYFQLQPIIVGVGGHRQVNGGLGCGGGGTAGIGGPGLVIIAAW